MKHLPSTNDILQRSRFLSLIIVIGGTIFYQTGYTVHAAPKPVEASRVTLVTKPPQTTSTIQITVQQAPVAPQPTPPPPPPAPDYSCITGYSSGDYYLDKIIAYESGGNSCATNPGGCFGLLQACPGYPLREACGGNPACQIQWYQDPSQGNKTGGRSWGQIWQHELSYGWW